MPWISRLLDHYETIRDEGLKLLRGNEYLPYLSPALAAGNWSDVTLLLSGARQEGSLLAPRTYEIVRSLGPDVTTMVSARSPWDRREVVIAVGMCCGPSGEWLRVLLPNERSIAAQASLRPH